MIVDVYVHHISRRIIKLIAKGKYYGVGKEFTLPEGNADPEVRLMLMEKYGVDIQAVSQTTPVLLGFGADDAAEICRLSNDDNFALCKAYPKKFLNICMISLLEVKSAMKELERSIKELDCRGVTVNSNQNGKGLDSPEYFPFYAELEKHDLPLFIHPTHWESYPLVEMEKGWRMMHIFGWPFDTTQAVWRLIFGGVLDRYPLLKIVTHHCGGMLPYFVRRAEHSCNGILRDKLSKPISTYWKNIYGDTVLDGADAAYMCGYAFFGPERMMFGSDYPFGRREGEDFIKENLAGVRTMNISDEDIAKILGGNAKKLLKIV